jgi:hypothetical protein
MRTVNPVIQLAKERALFRFTALAHPMIKDAINSISKAMESNRSDKDGRALAAASEFLQQDNTLFLNRIETAFAASLERAMATMYNDDRATINQFTGQELTLIDEKIVHEQIEVDRLLQRLRRADDADITKLNIIISQLHDLVDVKERENPFRPFLIAKTLYDVLHEMVQDRAVSTLLLEHLVSALAHHLAEYYSAVRDVFEANGVRAKLSARPSRAFRQLRIDDDTDAGAASDAQFKPRVLSGLQRMQTYSQKNSQNNTQQSSSGNYGGGGGGGGGQFVSGNASHTEELLSFVKKLFDQPSTSAMGFVSGSELSLEAMAGTGQAESAQVQSDQAALAKSMELIAKLTQMQKSAAESHVFHQTELTAQNQLFSVSEQIEANETTPKERTTIDVVAMLFEFILEDEQIPPTVRGQLARLQIPFLKAAMLAPEMLHDAQYPARVLLNRMSSSAIGLDLATPIGGSLSDEMTRIVTKILREFSDNVGLFAICLAELELFLAENLRKADAKFSLSVDALEAAEQSSTSKKRTGSSLQILLDPLMLDQRVIEFITKIWRRVLIREATDKKLKKSLRFRNTLPELVWSVQEKTSSERGELMRLLPELVIRLKAGLALIHSPERESKQALDHFVVMHMDVLRGLSGKNAQRVLSLDALREHFASLNLAADGTPDTAAGIHSNEPSEIIDAETESAGAQKVEAAAITAALADRGVTASLELGAEDMPEFDTETDWLDQMIVGICVERWTDGEFKSARLNWISKKKILYIFMFENNPKPLVYSDQSLIKGLREGSIRTVESAPAFDRAVQSLLSDAEALQSDTD